MFYVIFGKYYIGETGTENLLGLLFLDMVLNLKVILSWRVDC